MKRRDLVLLLVLVGIFVADRVTKILALDQPARAWFGPVGLQPILNSGVAFSLPLPSGLSLTLISLFALTFFCIAIRRWLLRRDWFAWALVAVGGFSNLLDRARFGGVLDFMRIGPLPIFNLADLMIIGGLLWMLRRDLTIGRPRA